MSFDPWWCLPVCRCPGDVETRPLRSESEPSQPTTWPLPLHSTRLRGGTHTSQHGLSLYTTPIGTVRGRGALPRANMASPFTQHPSEGGGGHSHEPTWPLPLHSTRLRGRGALTRANMASPFTQHLSEGAGGTPTSQHGLSLYTTPV